MATDFPVTQQQIIQAAMRQVGALDPAAQPTQFDYANIGLALNMLLKTWVAAGIPLWNVNTLTLPMVANQATYFMGTIGPDLVIDRPLRVLEAEILTISSNATITLRSLSREQYVERSGKFISFGQPVEYWFQPLGSEFNTQSASITMYPIPNVSSAWSVIMRALQPLNNVVALTDVLDFPAEYFSPLKFLLAYEIANEYPISDARYARIERRAVQSMQAIIDYGQEQDVEVRIKYDRRGR
jgi:hypothetical protein